MAKFELPPDQEIIAVAEKGNLRIVRKIKVKDKEKIKQSCLSKKWSTPTFYQIGFTTYKED